MSTSASPGDAMDARRRISQADPPGGGVGSPRQAFLFIRIWMPSQPAADNGSLHWRTESSLIHMITDLVSASGGSAAGKRRNGLIARFPNTPEAVAAAIRLQQAIAGFAGRSQATAAAFAVFAGDKDGSGLDESSDELETAGVLASAAQPAQILLTAAAYAELHLAAPYTSRSAAIFRMPSGVYSNLKAYELTRSTSQSSSGEQPPTRTKTRSRLTEQRGPVTERIQTEQSPAFPALSTQSGPLPPAEPALSPQTDVFNASFDQARSTSTSVIPSADAETVPSAPRSRAPLYAGLAGIAAVIVAAGTWSLTQRTVPPPTPAASGGTKQPQATEAPQSDPTSPATPNTSGGEAPGKVPQPLTSPRPKGTPPGRNPSEKGARTADGFFASDIPWLLTRADRKSGDGEYDAAESDYRIILKLDPGNSAARRGLGRNAARRSEAEQ